MNLIAEGTFCLSFENKSSLIFSQLSSLRRRSFEITMLFKVTVSFNKECQMRFKQDALDQKILSKFFPRRQFFSTKGNEETVGFSDSSAT